MLIGRWPHLGAPLLVRGTMRRTTSVLAALAGAGALLLAGTAPASADVHTATCAFTSYTLTGSFNIFSGTAAFTLGASGTCLGTSSGVTVTVPFRSVGPWSCVGGAATGVGWIAPNNSPAQQVSASLTNVGGEYVVELQSLTATAAGQFTTLPIACELGQTQTTIGGTGTLTFNAP